MSFKTYHFAFFEVLKHILTLETLEEALPSLLHTFNYRPINNFQLFRAFAAKKQS